MKILPPRAVVALSMGILVSIGCTPSDSSTPAGSGGRGGSGTTGSGGGSTPGSGGAAVTPGSGGTTTPGSGGATVTPGSGGAATPGSGGVTTTGTGGATTGTGGRGTGGRAGGASGTGGGSATGGATGVGGGSVGGATGTANGDDYVTGVTIAVHPQTTTILNVTWTQTKASENVWLEFSFAGSTVMKSRALPAATGMHRDVVLGVPASTAITVRIVNRQTNVDYKTKDYMGMTGAIPSSMPTPMVGMWDPALSTPERYLFGAVENSDGGCTNTSCYYHTTFWLYIMDRMGRIVWYYADGTSNATSSFQRIARDGEYIWIEKRPFANGGSRSVLKMTLDRQYSQSVNVPGLSDCIDVTTDGSLLYDANNELREMNKAGTVRTIWSCSTFFGQGFECYTNTINWDPVSDSVVMSYPEETTVIQVGRATGTVVGQYGSHAGSYAFMPTTDGFEYQHFANISIDGTLMVSTHLKGNTVTEKPVANQHAFMEFTIDRTNKRLIEKWRYTEGPEWAMYKGMALRLANGNTLGNYGTGGVIREVTPDKKTVFYVKWDSPNGNDFFNKMVGNNVFVDDLYALNGGGPKIENENETETGDEDRAGPPNTAGPATVERRPAIR